MRRDPTEFRQRFAAWKDGENYWDTRGEDMLPGYSGGKTGFYNTHRDKWKQFLISKGVDAEQASRLSTYFAAQDSLESGNGTSSAARQKNNFGGMQRGGKNISYDTVQDYMNDKWNMMNKRFSRALNAKTVQEYATLINDPKYAGKGYLYAVADGYNQKNPQDRAWVARQIQHMNNYTKAMMGIAGQKGFVARPVPKAPVVSKAEPIQKTNPIPSAVELLKQNELPVVLPEPTVTTTQTPTQAAQQAQLSEYIQKPLVSEKVPVLGGDYWENYFNNNSLDQFQSLIQQQMTSHKHGKNILPKHKDGKTPGEYNEELVELPEVRVDDEGNVVNNGRRGSIRLPEVVVNRTDPRNHRSAFDPLSVFDNSIINFVNNSGGYGTWYENLLSYFLYKDPYYGFRNIKYNDFSPSPNGINIPKLAIKGTGNRLPLYNGPDIYVNGNKYGSDGDLYNAFFLDRDTFYIPKSAKDALSKYANGNLYQMDQQGLIDLYRKDMNPKDSKRDVFLDAGHFSMKLNPNEAIMLDSHDTGNILYDSRIKRKPYFIQRIPIVYGDYDNSDLNRLNWMIDIDPKNMHKDFREFDLSNSLNRTLGKPEHDILNVLDSYKHGKSPIHINPANRGKFNALKKRTGKTTEQLTHSKNLLTRKRAIFALNSRKWRRK